MEPLKLVIFHLSHFGDINGLPADYFPPYNSSILPKDRPEQSELIGAYNSLLLHPPLQWSTIKRLCAFSTCSHRQRNITLRYSDNELDPKSEGAKEPDATGHTTADSGESILTGSSSVKFPGLVALDSSWGCPISTSTE